MKSLKADIFTIAIRKKKNKDECSLFDKTLLSEFELIKNPAGKWCADPFLLDYNGKTYLFAEIFNNFTRKGSIYVKEISSESKNSKWSKCSIAKCHLSFPNVFESNSKIYMIPETSENKELAMYECIDFPTKWKRTKTIMKGLKLVDSIRVDDNSFFSYDLTELDRKLLLIKDNKIVSEMPDKEKILRPAGSSVKYGKKSFFPMQICTNQYGEGINVNEFNNGEFKTISSLLPKEIKVKKHSFIGLHTYNYSDAYEVIDLKEKKFSILRIIGKPFRLIFRSRKA